MNNIDKSIISDYVLHHIDSPIPDDIMKIITYKLVESSVIFTLALIGILVCAKTIYKIYKSNAKWKYSSYDGSISEGYVFSILGLVVLIVGFIAIGVQGFDFVKILISPKYFLTDYITSL